MNSRIRYTLGKSERLKSRKTIERLFKQGHSFTIYPFRVLYQLTGEQRPGSFAESKRDSGLKAGFTVSSRHFRRAVDRNRVKRLMRESWRLQKKRLGTEIAGAERRVLTSFPHLYC